VRVGGIRPGQTIPTSGFAGNFYNLTAGLNWTPHANIAVRPEVRYDCTTAWPAPAASSPSTTARGPISSCMASI